MSSEESGSVQSDMDSEDYYPLRSNDDGDREELPESGSEEGENWINLEALSMHPHPSLASGHFSIYNSPDVGPLSLASELEYTMDMDGVVVLSKHLSTFRICQFGEARAYTKCVVTNMYHRLSKSQLFETLPADLSLYERWLPGFKFVDAPMNSVHVVFRTKLDATADDMCGVRGEERSLAREWWMSILLPAVHSLPEDTKTRLFNTITTFQTTGILPTYLRIYSDDLPLLSSTLQDATMESSLHHHLSWYFVYCKYGQRHEIAEGETLGPEAFRLGAMFNLSTATVVSIHLAINFKCKDKRYSLFWHRQKTFSWSTSVVNTRRAFPLFGLTELANVYVPSPRNPFVEAATGGHKVTFLQHYTPMVKAMENEPSLRVRPHLLTYLLGAKYVSKRAKFKQVWDEVNTQRTLHELLELMHPTVPFDARMEVVITDNNVSFLSSFCHKRLARAVMREGLLIKVPTRHFAGYVQNLVKELYQPMQAAIQGTLTGPGTLGTVLLCESLLNYLITGSYRNQAYHVLKAYDIAPLGALAQTRKVDLRSFATLRDGFLYVTRPKLEKVWVPLSSLPSSARATASAMLTFLEKLKAGRSSIIATTRAAEIIVTQFKHDLVEMGVVTNAEQFQSTMEDACVRDALTADEYVARVFIPDHLPSEMSTKAFLTMAMDLLDQSTLREKIAQNLLEEAKMVPRTTVHARTVNFSPSVCTLLVKGQLSGRLMTADDAQRLVLATTPLLSANFDLDSGAVQAVQSRRPRLTRCVRNAVEKVRSRTRGHMRNTLAVVCFATVVLANKEKIFGEQKLKYKRLYRTTNLSRYISLKEMKEIVARTWDGDFDARECRIILDKIIIPHGPRLRHRHH